MKTSDPRRSWSPASCAEFDRETEISSMEAPPTCLLVFRVLGGFTSSRLRVRDAGRLFRKLLRYLSFRKLANRFNLTQRVDTFINKAVYMSHMKAGKCTVQKQNPALVKLV